MGGSDLCLQNVKKKKCPFNAEFNKKNFWIFKRRSARRATTKATRRAKATSSGSIDWNKTVKTAFYFWFLNSWSIYFFYCPLNWTLTRPFVSRCRLVFTFWFFIIIIILNICGDHWSVWQWRTRVQFDWIHVETCRTSEKSNLFFNVIAQNFFHFYFLTVAHRRRKQVCRLERFKISTVFKKFWRQIQIQQCKKTTLTLEILH